MMTSSTVDSSVLSACDREPVHLLGAIQPFGFLVSVNADWMVVRASENIGAALGVDHADLLGRSSTAFIPEEVLHDIRGRLQLSREAGVVERLLARRLAPEGPLFDIAMHRSGREIVLEFEPSGGESRAALSTLRAMLARVERHQAPEAVYKEATRQIAALTGFERVMVYRFSPDGSGEVVAERAKSGLPPYLGLRYPASDIPRQARALYERNFLRIIVDVNAEPVAVTPARTPEGDMLDLSMSVLRSVSPVHLEYLRNMGVRSSMSISILRDGHLWGLIACHHGKPMQLGLETRSTAELFGQMFSYLLEARLRDADARFESHALDIHARLAAAFTDRPAALGELPQFLIDIPGYIACDGIGVYQDGEVTLAGLTPTREEFVQLLRFLNTTAQRRAFATHQLSEVFPPAADYVTRAAGLLSVPISRMPRDYLVFFRREVEKNVTWAGEPVKPETPGPDGMRLTPRKSFDAWREIVRHQSEPWAARETRAAEALRTTLVELTLRRSDVAEAERTSSGQRQEILIAELNHRVRNIFGLVRGLITQSANSAEDVQHFVDSLESRVGSLARAHDLLTSSNGNPISLHALLQAEFEAYSPVGDHLALLGPDILLQPTAFSTIALVVHELVTNARKYGALKVPGGRITLQSAVDAAGDIAISWRESGGPPVAPPQRRGFGSTILEELIPFELDGVSTARYPPTGLELDLVLPAAVAQAASDVSGAIPFHDKAMDGDVAGLASLLAKTLLVEDNLFIALDAEDLLRSFGAASVEVARSVPEALEAMTRTRFSFALLDFNLGSETSLPVARALKARQISFAFGTGYGSTLEVPEALGGVLVISKPYHRA
ncbi:MAG: HWE histidine kinase domain-containing protein, partial [Dongiaceae bacterium]